jgi:uncharacterized membrane protein YdfJ with MMPL/SSD domain
MLDWTRLVIRHRRVVLALWAVTLVFGALAASDLGRLLSNRFSVPGSDAERGLDLIKGRMHERGDGAFTLVVRGAPGAQLAVEARAAAARGASAVPGAKAGQVQVAAPGIVYVQIPTPLENAKAADKVPAMRRAIGTVPGAKTYLTGYPAVNHDTQPISSRDITRGEAIAIPIALLVMLFMFGTLGAVAVPFAFALATIPTTLGAVWLFAHTMDMATYVQQIVTLIGFAIAIDYSMLVVFRYREELERGDHPHAALARTMSTAGRATLFSGMTVAIGLALLILMPLPFMRSMGVGGVLVPLVSIAASATFLPALLAVMGSGINRFRLVPRSLLRRRAQGETGFWTRLAHSIMRRPIPFFVAALALMVALALPATELRLTGGDNRGMPTTTEATRGLKLLERTLGPGALAPQQIVVDTGRAGGAWSPQSLVAQKRLVALLRSDREVKAATIQAPVSVLAALPRPQAVALAQQSSLVDASGRVFQVRAAGHGDAGTTAAIELVHRIRRRYVPAARLPGRTVLSGAPAFGVDFVARAYGAFPWLVLAVLVLSYLLLMRAFRSLFLPLKAVFMNLLSVSAAYGVLVLTFQHHWGKVVGLGGTPQIDAWIPIFLFAMLFGLSMDYEVFLLTRMREEWDRVGDNEHAVAYGLEHTGRIITAAAIIMVAAFTGFTAGSFISLQEFGVGLSAAILLDATVVRAILVPATMKLVGDWNWYLPGRLSRLLRLPRRKVRV